MLKFEYLQSLKPRRKRTAGDDDGRAPAGGLCAEAADTAFQKAAVKTEYPRPAAERAGRGYRKIEEKRLAGVSAGCLAAFDRNNL